MKNKPYLLQNEAFDVILDYFKNIPESHAMSDTLCLALKKLEQIKQNNLTLTWKQLGVIAAVENFLTNSDGKPLTRQRILDDSSLPSAAVFKNAFGKTPFQWVMSEYPYHTRKSSTDFIYGGKAYADVEEVKDAFIKEYYRIRPTTQDEYDAKKSRTIPYWQSVAGKLGVTSWRKLLSLLGLPRYDKHEDTPLRVVETNLRITDSKASFTGKRRPHVLKKTFWTEELVHQRIEGFIIENKRPPMQKELLTAPELPAPVTIERIVKKNWRLWIKETFPDCASESWQYDLLASAKVEQKKWLTLFRKEYKRIRPTSGRQYNEQRKQGTPTWNTIAKLIGEDKNKWDNLKKVAGVDNILIHTKEPPKEIHDVEINVSVKKSE